MSDLHRTFSISQIWSKTWFRVENDLVLQVSSQEPSTSSKSLTQSIQVRSRSHFQDRSLSNYPLPLQSPTWKNPLKYGIKHDLGCPRSPLPPSLQSGTINILQVPNKVKSCAISIKLSGFLQYDLKHILGCRRWPRPWSLQSGTINIFQVPNSVNSCLISITLSR